MEQLREVFERLQPYLLVIKDIVMWFGTTALELINQIDKRILEEDSEKKIKEIEKQLNDAESLEKKFIGTSKQLEDFKKEIEAAGNDKEKVQEIIAKYEPLFEIEKGWIYPKTNTTIDKLIKNLDIKSLRSIKIF